MTSNGTGEISSSIHVTPLIDVLLVLLIISMVIVPIMPKGLAANVPQPPRANSAAHHDAVVVSVIQGQGVTTAYRINAQDVNGKGLLARLTAIYANRAERVLFVKGDDDLPFAQIAEVMDIGHPAGVESIALLNSNR